MPLSEQIPDILAVSGPELIILLAALFGIVLGAVFKNRFDALAFSFSASALFLAGLVALWNTGSAQAFFGCLTPEAPNRVCAEADVFALLRSHGFIDYVRTVSYLLASFVLIMSFGFLKNHNAIKFEYPLLILFACFGIGITLTAGDLMSLYMGIETLSLSSYILAAYLRQSSKSSEAGLKYFLLGALASGLLLYGASLVFGFTGSTQYSVIADAVNNDLSIGLTFGLVLMIIGLGFKVSAAPMHVWTPDVYEGAPTPVVAFFSAIPKFSGLAVMTIILFEVFGGIHADWQPILAIMAMASMLIGTFAALAQNNLKRLLAYSSIANVGYALIGVTAGTSLGTQALLVFMTIYAVSAIGLFLGVMLLRRKGGMVEDINELSGLVQNHPVMAISLTLILVSIAGLPSGGLWGKIALFQAGLDAELHILVILLILTSVVSLAYYLRLIYIMWVKEPVAHFEPVSNVLKLGILSCALVSGLVFFFAIGQLDAQASEAANALGL